MKGKVKVYGFTTTASGDWEGVSAGSPLRTRICVVHVMRTQKRVRESLACGWILAGIGTGLSAATSSSPGSTFAEVGLFCVVIMAVLTMAGRHIQQR